MISRFYLYEGSLQNPASDFTPDIRRIARTAEKMTPEERKKWLESSWQVGKVLFPEAFKEE
jgi:hypothetical protein